jgi:hypothetical protein
MPNHSSNRKYNSIYLAAKKSNNSYMAYWTKLDMGQQWSSAKDNNTTNTNTNPDAHILEQGDIYFSYRPKKDAQEVKGVEDVRRFFMVIAPEGTESM